MQPRSVTLNNGVQMPMIGAGTFEVPPGKRTMTTVKIALEEGYRHIDTAQWYGNEADVGKALKGSGLERDDVFITTKLANPNQGHDAVLRSFARSLKDLATPYVDLFLMHWPVEKLRKESYLTMEKLLQDGKCRAIGVSNFTIRHIEELISYANVVPAVNQVEFHPFLFQKELMEHCGRLKIQLEAYSPLARGERMNDPTLLQIAKRLGRTQAQILLRWAIQHDVVAIPKSVHRERLKENLDIGGFRLGHREMEMLDSLNENYHACWDPTNAP